MDGDRTAPGVPNNKRSNRLREANYCLSLGVGVGALGAAGAAVAGAACPLCIFIAPALIGAGVIGRIRATKSESVASPELLKPTASDNEPIEES